MDAIADAGSGVKAGRREWIGLAVLALPTLLLALDSSVLYLALPQLSADLDAGSTQLLWITDIYGFLIAGCLVTMGTLGDRIGRRRLLMIGAGLFALASVAAAYSTGAEMLIATRALMGITGATLMPSTLALLSNMFRDPKQMGTAIAVWMSCFMGGMAIGPVVGGVLLENFWWGSVFLLSVPVMGLLLVAGPRLLPEYRDPNAGKVDVLSVIMSLATILPLIYGLKELAKSGVQATSLVAIAVGVVVGLLFIRRQRTLEHPLLDLRLFGNRSFSAALIIMVFGGVMSGTFLLINLYLQTVEGLSPLRAGLWLVPGTVATVLGLQLAPIIARKVRPAYTIAGGLLVMAIGYALVTQVDNSTGIGLLVAGIYVSALGAGPMAGLGTGLIMASAPPEKAGSAASLSETGGELGIALGIAAIGSVGTAVYGAQISDAIPAGVPAQAAATASESIASAVHVAADLPGATGAGLLAAAREAFTSALNSGAAVSAGLAVLLAVLAAVALRHVNPSGDHGHGGGAEESGEAAAGSEPSPPAVQVTTG
ncbi:MFS transporter [Sphaerisporangium siamense]|uniref:DHA2 family multidrug resistance protein-like MFS transporter n=1 Tax=Sphaerisporangium siamense TaxID=795645 RepID=A0A7W7GCX5_9ACTN|nr:MFS transporter [Sphaerisporangium siamense]MBB4702416.1 DHA2 family multidrug resistance protein-like MFS transporter [Sphaerisporangium siamense]GII88949.1 MFS transporter [Sphaerisporangium siamense]